MANEWIAGNRYLSKTEQQNNAKIIWDYLGSAGWSLNAVCGMLGNMQTESTVNPQIWESLKPNEKRGYGLTQWTPATKLISWAGTRKWQNGYIQLDRIIWEKDNNQQWFRNPKAPIVEPPYSFKVFSTSHDDVETLANYFLWYYEHPAVTIQPKRGEQAQEWWKFFMGDTPDPDPPDPPPPTPDPKGKFTSWEFLKYIGRHI